MVNKSGSNKILLFPRDERQRQACNLFLVEKKREKIFTIILEIQKENKEIKLCNSKIPNSQSPIAIKEETKTSNKTCQTKHKIFHTAFVMKDQSKN